MKQGDAVMMVIGVFALLKAAAGYTAGDSGTTDKKRFYTSGSSPPQGSHWYLVDSQWGDIDWATAEVWLPRRTPLDTSDSIEFKAVRRRDGLVTIYATKRRNG